MSNARADCATRRDNGSPRATTAKMNACCYSRSSNCCRACCCFRPTILLLLLLFIGRAATIFPRPPASNAPVDFLQFTAPQYNMSIFENAEVGTVAMMDGCAAAGPLVRLRAVESADKEATARQFGGCAFGAERVGVQLPKGYHQISFKIVDGDKSQRFTATARRVGNFAFLIVEFRHEDILNRELEFEYRLIVRAVAKRRRAGALETSTVIHLRVRDENDNAPMFRRIDYAVNVDDRVPVNARLVRLDGFDADENLNGELLYSVVGSPPVGCPLYVEPHSGWMRSYGALAPGNYSIECRIEDRASRLANVSPAAAIGFIRNRAIVRVTVTEKRTVDSPKPRVHLVTVPIEPYKKKEQLAGRLRVEDALVDAARLEICVEAGGLPSNYWRVERRADDAYDLHVSNTSAIGTPITVQITVAERLLDEDTRPRDIHTVALNLTPDDSQRRVWFDWVALRAVAAAMEGGDSAKTTVDEIGDEPIIFVTVSETSPIGEVIEQFPALTTYAEEQSKIWYKLQPLPDDESAVGSKPPAKGFPVSPFDLSERHGQLRLKSALDFDDGTQRRRFVYRLSAHLDSAIAAARLIVQLADANDNCPQFVNSVTSPDFVVRLDAKATKIADMIVFNAQATDTDSGRNGRVVYKLLNAGDGDTAAMAAERFRINALTGEVRVNGLLPSNENGWPLRILAMDLGAPLPHFSQLTVVVQRGNTTATPTVGLVLGVVDSCSLLNEFAPVFQTKPYETPLAVDEDAAIGTRIGEVSATDADAGYAGWVRYALDDVFFGVNANSGTLFVRADLTPLVQRAAVGGQTNAEHVDHFLEVLAQDGGTTPTAKLTRATFRVRIRGANRHAPEFTQIHYTAVVEEGRVGVELLRVLATDRDVGEAGRVARYTLVAVDGAPNDAFVVDTTTGSLRIERALSRDRRVHLALAAADAGRPPLFSFVNVTIDVQDANDRAPRCLREVHTARLFEDAPDGQLVLCLAVVGANAKLDFTLAPRSDSETPPPFRVNAASGCLFVNESLDYEILPLHEFNITVRDGGKSTRPSTDCAVRIELIDVEEDQRPPHFADVVYEATVDEDASPHTEVLRVTAVDPEGSPIAYRLVGGSGLGAFEIDSHTGAIRTASGGAPPTADHVGYWLTVCASDAGGRTAVAHVHLRVANRRRRVPVFAQPIHIARVAENSAENKIVAKIEAAVRSSEGTSGGKAGGSVKYSIVKGNPQSHFTIDEISGNIVTGRRRLDYETQPEHELEVRACLDSAPCASALVVVSVEDVNDCAPTFSAPSLYVDVPADQPAGAFLARVFAADADAPASANSALSYRIDDGADAERFRVDAQGCLSAVEPLKAGVKYSVRLVARDGGQPPLEGNTTLTITVVGRANKFTVSNRRPRLLAERMWRELFVSDGDTIGAAVGKVSAVDDDGDALWWSLLDEGALANLNASFAFRNGADGELVLARRVTAIDPSLNEIKLRFRVSDGLDFVDDTITVRISRSSSGARPEFAEPHASVTLSADAPAGAVLHTARAHFPPSAPSQPPRIVYALHSVDDAGAADLFRVDQRSGNLLLAGAPSRLRAAFSPTTVIIAATAGGSGCVNFQRVDIQLAPANEHTPVFVHDAYAFVAPLVDNGDTYVGFVEAYDVDVGDFGRITYEIVGGDNHGYRINSTTGELYRRRQKNAVKNPDALTIRATDAAVPPRSSTCAVHVYDDAWLNERATPRLDVILSLRRLDIDDDTVAGADLALLEAPGAVAPVSYALGGVTPAACISRVHVNFASGRVRVAPGTWRVEEPLHANCTFAAVAGRLEETVTASLNVIPSDWRVPRFERDEYTALIEESAPAGRALDDATAEGTALRVNALARKADANILYRVVDLIGDERRFIVEPSEGLNETDSAVVLRNIGDSFDFETTRSMTLAIVAQIDALSTQVAHQRASLMPVLVHVTVRDKNDAPPRFTRAAYAFTLRWPPVYGTVIGTLDATDPDMVGDLRYALRAVEACRIVNTPTVYTLSDVRRLFHVDRRSGAITVGVDDETLFAFDVKAYTLDAIVSDGLHTGATTATIRIVRDVPPTVLRFSQVAYTITVAENQSVVPPTATADEPPLLSLWPARGRLGEAFAFRLASPHPAFELDEKAGLLRLNRSVPLDREATPRLKLAVVALSRQTTVGHTSARDYSNAAYAVITVDVEDVNDCAPRFTQELYTADVADAPASEEVARVAIVRATDADVGMGGVVRYRLAEDAPKFLELNKYDGRITVVRNGSAALERGAEYRFHVIAADQGLPSLESCAEVRLRVVSRHQPICAQTRYRTRIADAAAPGAHVVTIRATLLDGTGMVRYALKNDDENGDPYRNFDVDFVKGVISLRRPLNAQLQSRYQLTIEAFDVTRVTIDDEPTLRAACLVEITVDLSNAVAPTFDRLDYVFTVSEESPIGTPLGTVRATTVYNVTELSTADDDDGDRGSGLTEDIVYLILEGNRSVILLDQTTGQLSLAARLDYEQQSYYEFLVSARTTAGLTAQAVVRLRVSDANDCAPEWHGKRPLRLTVSRGEGNGDSMFLYRFGEPELVDVDGTPTNLQFAVAHGDETIFSVDARTGTLTASRAALEDATVVDNRRDRALNISVSDGVHTVYVDVVVTVPPTRENTLRFQSNVYTVVISESRESTNSSALLTLRAADGTEPLTFALIGASPADNRFPLAMHPTDGRMFLRRPLDRERDGPRITVPVTVSDREGCRAFAAIHVNIADENDNAPVWIAPPDGYAVCVDATAVSATREGDLAPFATVLAVDADVDDRLEYMLLDISAPFDRLFDVHPTTGAIGWRRDANASSVASGETRLRVRVLDSGNPPHQSDVRLRVKLMSASANVPRFGQPRFFFAVGENSPARTIVGDVLAIVTGAQVGQPLRYELLSVVDDRDSFPFMLDADSGEITVASGARLDHESHQRYDFVVGANVANSDCSAYAIVTVVVVDANDNAPVFQTVYDEGIDVREDTPPGTVVALFLAEDADRQTSASRIIYSIENDSTIEEAFIIDPADGRLTVGPAGLDRERHAIYHLRVFAADEAHRQNAGQVVEIRVGDVNDEPPKFDRPSGYELIIGSDEMSLAEGRAILHFNITDADGPSFNKALHVFVAECVSSNNHDILNAITVARNQSTLVLTRSATRIMRVGGTWHVCLFAGDGRHYSNVTVDITAAPSVIHETFDSCRDDETKITVAGNVDIGTTVFTFPSRSTARLIRKPSDAFQLKNSSLIIAGADFYRRPNYTLHFQIHSANLSDDSSASCFNTVHITVLPANRVAPKFSQAVYTVTVSENLNVSLQHAHFLLRVEARDDDVGAFGRVRYTLVPSDTGGASNSSAHFALDAHTGALTLHRELDRETNAHIELRVRAEDGGGLQDYATITVNVKDVNDNAPAFLQDEYRIQVLESEPVGHQLLVLRAEDRDFHAHVTYALDTSADASVGSHFVIDALSGALRLIAPLDAERRRQWTLHVIASDGVVRPLTATVRVIVDVLDINDNAPRFDRQLYEATLSEAAMVGTRVLQVSATDLDSEHFGRVNYLLSGAPAATEGSSATLSQSSSDSAAHYFEIDSATGWLTLRRQVDYERVRELRLNVHAVDGGQPPLSDDAIVHITIIDVNDNAPAFSTCNQTAVVQEGVPTGHALLAVTLSDADGPPNGAPFQLTLSGDGATLFAFDPLHNLITTQPMTYRIHQQFTLNMTATDAGGLRSFCPIRIFVKPQSKFPPEIQPLTVTVNTLYGEFLGGAIGRVSASDKDPSDLLRYSIADSTPFIPYSVGLDGQQPSSILATAPRFTIDAESGVLSASADLLPGLYRFNVSVTDGKFVAGAPVSVDVADVDQMALDHALSARLRGVGTHRFVGERLAAFQERIARAVGAAPSSVHLLSIEEARSDSDLTFSRYRRDVNEYSNASMHYSIPSIESSRDHLIHYLSQRDTSSSESSEDIELDILFTVQRDELLSSSSSGYYRPTYVKQRVETAAADYQAAADVPPLEITRLSAEVCRRDICVKGECRDRLWLDNRRMRIYTAADGAAAFVAPAHRRAFECICRPGFGGRYCDVPVNQCSKELCMRTEMCIPSEEHAPGFVCSCPPGLRGERCTQPTCTGAPAGVCAQREAISLLGAGFFQLALSSSVEARLELGLSFRTLSRDATLMYGAGDSDFHELRLKSGVLEYRWSCGSGVGAARFGTTQRVDDGAWHKLTVSRRGRQTRIVLDGVHVAEGTSPPGSDVVNLYRQASVLTFGARVSGAYESPLVRETVDDHDAAEAGTTAAWEPQSHRHRRHHRQHRHHQSRRAATAWRETAADLRLRVDSGMVGCFGRVAVDGYDVPKTEQGLRLHNAAVGCDESHMGPCLRMPCKNAGQCMPNRTHNTYSCSCPLRFTGAHCEIDLNACAAAPCPNGIACHNLYNDFHCSCPPGFTDKTCQLRGDRDPCITAPCGPHGACQRRAALMDGTNFVCRCEDGYAGQFCSETDASTRWSRAIALNSLEFYGLLVAVATTVFLAALAICVCQRRAAGVSKDARRASRNSRRKQTNCAPRSLGSADGGTGGGSLLSSQRTSNDDGSTPLVPRHTAAPCHTAANDRPPPPLPPKLRPCAQLYQNLNGGTGGRTASASGSSLALNGFGHAQYHVNGLPAVEVRPMRAGSASCVSPLFNKPDKDDSAPQPPLHGPPTPPPHKHQQQQQHEVRQQKQQQICTTRASQRFSQNGALSVARQLYDRVTAEAAAGGGGAPQANGDYLTMKPVHRAKPFFNANAPALSQLSDEGEESDVEVDRNDDYVEAQIAPIPPVHGKSPATADGAVL